MLKRLRKRLKKLMIENHLVFIEVYFPLNITNHIIIGVFLHDEYDRIKYETNYVIIIYEIALKAVYKLTDANDYRRERAYYHHELELIDNDYITDVIKAVINNLTINPKTYRLSDYIYYKNERYYRKIRNLSA